MSEKECTHCENLDGRVCTLKLRGMKCSFMGTKNYWISEAMKFKRELQASNKRVEEAEEFRNIIKDKLFNYETLDNPWTDEQILDEFEKAINICDGCDVAERMRKLVYLVSNGMMSYANYTYEAMEEVYYEQLQKQIDNEKENLETQLTQANEKIEKTKKFIASLSVTHGHIFNCEQILKELG